MRKVLGFGLALVLMLPLSAAADGITGKVKTVDPADHSIVLEDGTKLWVSDEQLADLTPLPATLPPGSRWRATPGEARRDCADERDRSLSRISAKRVQRSAWNSSTVSPASRIKLRRVPLASTL